MKVPFYFGFPAICLMFALSGLVLTSGGQIRQMMPGNGAPVLPIPLGPQADQCKMSVKAIWDGDHDTGIQTEESLDEDMLRFDIAGKERMIIDDAGNVGIGEAPPNDTRLFVKSSMPDWQYAIHGEGMQGIRGVSTAFEGTGVSGEGGHAGVMGSGFIGILGFGFYGGWFDGHGHFSGKLGVGITDPESRLHVNGAVTLAPTVEPPQPAEGFVLFCDSSDGKLKAKSCTGKVSVLADR